MRVRQWIRMCAGALALASTAPAMAQFSQEVLRYQASQAECRQAFERRAAGRCDEACRARAEAGRQRCLATAERRYQAALRRAMEIRY